ncbi:hypothetical protein BGM25_29495, partial [Bacillus sp. FJAT-29953]|nr:hypothetical protein [Bacillus sp. FJAT-29953]
ASTAFNLVSKVYLVIKKLHLQLLCVSNNWGAVHYTAPFFLSSGTILVKDIDVMKLSLTS